MTNLINKILRPFGFAMGKVGSASGRWIPTFGSSFGNASKEKVNNNTALTLSTVYACIRNISEDVAKIPLKVYRKDGNYRYEETSHPLVNILQNRPNPEMTAISFRETLNAHAMGWGNGYAEIQRDVFGNPLYLWPLRPDRVTVYREAKSHKVFYRILTNNAQTSDIWAEDIFHLHGLGSDGVSGYNIIQMAAQSIGSAIGMDKFAGAYFSNGLHQSGILTHPKNLSTEAGKRLKTQLEGEFGGSERAHQIMIAEEGMTYASIIIDPKKSQMIETRQFSVTEFCRWMRIPPHKVADLSRATFSNIEEQNIDYVQDGLLGWCERWEQSLWWKLLSEKEKNGGYYFQHVIEGLLRGNIKARYEAYALLWDRGILSINEIRAKENLNPVDEGDQRFVPLNYTTLENAGQSGLVSNVVNDISQRLASREIKELEKHVKHADKDIVRFKNWLDEFYSKHDRYIVDAILPLSHKFKRSICIDLFSLKPLLKITNNPVSVLEDRKDKHASYIANNLRSYYEN